jgi:hypothetical protein
MEVSGHSLASAAQPPAKVPLLHIKSMFPQRIKLRTSESVGYIPYLLVSLIAQNAHIKTGIIALAFYQNGLLKFRERIFGC